MIAFIIKSSVSLLLFYSFYKIFLSKENMPVFKRYYLLFGIFFSLIIPFISFEMNVTLPDAVNYMTISHQIKEIDSYNQNILMSDQNDFFSMKWILYFTYFFVFIILLFRYLFNLSRIFRKDGDNYSFLYKGYKVVVLENNVLPFSFLHTIYINRKDFNNGAVKQELLIHELTHIKEKHSIDILLIELLQVFCWFNPIIWFYKKEIRLNHEYLADKQVITNGIEICDYQKFILGFVFRNNSSYLASNFNYSFIKKRFIMLTKEKSSVRARIKAAITIPVITIMAVIISFNQNIIAMNNGFNLDKEWWNPILEKHKLVPDKAFNNFENIFEMADQISMKNNVSTLTNAVVIIKSNDKNSDYMLIEGPLVKHDLDSGAIEVHEGTIKFYKMDSEISNPVAHAHGDKMIINADNASFN